MIENHYDKEIENRKEDLVDITNEFNSNEILQYESESVLDAQ